MDKSDVEIIDKTTAYDGYFRIDRYRLRHRLYDGGWSREVMREVFERGHAAAVLPYDPVRDAAVLIEQFRIGAYTADWKPWIEEVVAGVIEPHETPEAVARRETFEESGCTVTDMVKICDYMSTPGGASEMVSLYCGRVDAGAITALAGHAGEDEDIRVFALHFDEVVAGLQAGRFDNSAIIIALQWLVLNRDDLRRRWGC